MAMSKIDRIDREIEKTRGKITEYQNRLKELEAQRTEQENFAWLEAAGFEAPSVEESFEVEADRGYKAGHVVPKVAGDENVKFTAVSLYVRKKR